MSDEEEFISFDDVPEEGNLLAEWEAGVVAIKQRCSNANINVEEFKDESIEGEVGLKIQLPAGRDKRTIIVASLDEIDELLTIKFEDYITGC